MLLTSTVFPSTMIPLLWMLPWTPKTSWLNPASTSLRIFSAALLLPMWRLHPTNQITLPGDLDDHLDRRYTDRTRLLVEILLVLAQEPHFALKGGTAINLFEHDLPRLSVHIDLAWLPVHDYAEDAKLIAEALGKSMNWRQQRHTQLAAAATYADIAPTCPERKRCREPQSG